MDSLKEIGEFLDFNSRLDLKAMALQYVSGISETQEGQELLLGIPEILKQLILLLQDDSHDIVTKCALSTLINISGNEDVANALLLISETSICVDENEKSTNLIYLCCKNIIDRKCKLADRYCMILSNITRPYVFVDRIITLIERSKFSLRSIINAFTPDYNTRGVKLHDLGSVFSNLSQSKKMRDYLMDKEECPLKYLLPHFTCIYSIMRRKGVIGTIRNCCFDVQNHEFLISSDVDIVSYILIPLLGQEQVTYKDKEKLPMKVQQYLTCKTEREKDPDIRKMLLETLNQLCATRTGREYLREKNVYVILRELHKWEKDKAVLLVCENVIDILIKTEEEIGHDNLKEIVVPEKYKEDFHKMDKLYLEEEINTEIEH